MNKQLPAGSKPAKGKTPPKPLPRTVFTKLEAKNSSKSGNKVSSETTSTKQKQNVLQEKKSLPKENNVSAYRPIEKDKSTPKVQTTPSITVNSKNNIKETSSRNQTEQNDITQKTKVTKNMTSSFHSLSSSKESVLRNNDSSNNKVKPSPGSSIYDNLSDKNLKTPTSKQTTNKYITSANKQSILDISKNISESRSNVITKTEPKIKFYPSLNICELEAENLKDSNGHSSISNISLSKPKKVFENKCENNHTTSIVSQLIPHASLSNVGNNTTKAIQTHSNEVLLGTREIKTDVPSNSDNYTRTSNSNKQPEYKVIPNSSSSASQKPLSKTYTNIQSNTSTNSPSIASTKSNTAAKPSSKTSSNTLPNIFETPPPITSAKPPSKISSNISSNIPVNPPSIISTNPLPTTSANPSPNISTNNSPNTPVYPPPITSAKPSTTASSTSTKSPSITSATTTTTTKTNFNLTLSIVNLSQKFGIGPLRRPKYNKSSSKNRNSHSVPGPENSFTEYTTSNTQRGSSNETASANNLSGSAGAINRQTYIRSISENASSQTTTNHVNRSTPSRSRNQEYRRSTSMNRNNRNNLTESIMRSHESRRTTPGRNSDLREPIRNLNHNSELRPTARTHTNDPSLPFPIGTATGANLTGSSYSSRKIKVQLQNLEDFINAYDKITEHLRNGRENILTGNYRQACSDFETALKMMDCVIEISVNQLQLSILNDTMCKSIQDVVCIDRKTALEGFSDAQAGILHPRDITSSGPDGAPPSYTDVLNQDLRNSFSGKGGAAVNILHNYILGETSNVAGCSSDILMPKLPLSVPPNYTEDDTCTSMPSLSSQVPSYYSSLGETNHLSIADVLPSCPPYIANEDVSLVQTRGDISFESTNIVEVSKPTQDISECVSMSLQPTSNSINPPVFSQVSFTGTDVKFNVSDNMPKGKQSLSKSETSCSIPTHSNMQLALPFLSGSDKKESTPVTTDTKVESQCNPNVKNNNNNHISSFESDKFNTKESEVKETKPVFVTEPQIAMNNQTTIYPNLDIEITDNVEIKDVDVELKSVVSCPQFSLIEINDNKDMTKHNLEDCSISKNLDTKILPNDFVNPFHSTKAIGDPSSNTISHSTDTPNQISPSNVTPITKTTNPPNERVIPPPIPSTTNLNIYQTAFPFKKYNFPPDISLDSLHSKQGPKETGNTLLFNKNDGPKKSSKNETKNVSVNINHSNKNEQKSELKPLSKEGGHDLHPFTPVPQKRSIFFNEKKSNVEQEQKVNNMQIIQTKNSNEETKDNILQTNTNIYSKENKNDSINALVNVEKKKMKKGNNHDINQQKTIYKNKASANETEIRETKVRTIEIKNDENPCVQSHHNQILDNIDGNIQSPIDKQENIYENIETIRQIALCANKEISSKKKQKSDLEKQNLKALEQTALDSNFSKQSHISLNRQQSKESTENTVPMSKAHEIKNNKNPSVQNTNYQNLDNIKDNIESHSDIQENIYENVEIIRQIASNANKIKNSKSKNELDFEDQNMKALKQTAFDFNFDKQSPISLIQNQSKESTENTVLMSKADQISSSSTNKLDKTASNETPNTAKSVVLDVFAFEDPFVNNAKRKVVDDPFFNVSIPHNESLTSVTDLSPSSSYQNLGSREDIFSSNSDIDSIVQKLSASKEGMYSRNAPMYASANISNCIEVRRNDNPHYQSKKVERSCDLNIESIIKKPLVPQRPSVLCEFDPFKPNRSPDSTKKIETNSDEEIKETEINYLNEKALQLELTENCFKPKSKLTQNETKDVTQNTNLQSPHQNDELNTDNGAYSQPKNINNSMDNFNLQIFPLSMPSSDSPNTNQEAEAFSSTTSISSSSDVPSTPSRSSISTTNAFAKLELGLRKGIHTLSTLTLSSNKDSSSKETHNNNEEDPVKIGRSEFYTSHKKVNFTPTSNWKEILKFEKVKLYFIKEEKEYVMPEFRPNLIVSQEISQSITATKPIVRLSAASQSEPSIWSRDLTKDNVNIFKTISDHFIFSENEGVFVGLSFSSKTNSMQIFKFTNLIMDNSWFEKEKLGKESSSSKQPSKVKKLFTNLVGEKAEQIRITAKDVSRQSRRSINFAQTTIHNLREEPLSVKRYQEPKTKKAIGKMESLQRIGRLLERSVYEKKFKITF